MSIHLWLALGIAVIALFYDVTQFRIPNWLSIMAVLTGFIYHIAFAGLAGAAASLLGLAAGFIPMLLLYWCKGIGAGDVKLFAGFGAIIGAGTVIQLIAASFIFGGFISLGFLAYRMLLKLAKRHSYFSNALLIEAPSNDKLLLFGIHKLHQFPFMLAVAPAMLAIWVMSL